MRIKNVYKDYKGEYHVYGMDSDIDTPEKRSIKNRRNAVSKCGLTSCLNYKKCDLNQIGDGQAKCVNYKKQ